MRKLFKQTKVVYDAHEESYYVYYKNFLLWRFDQAYKVRTHCPDARAREMALARAKCMLDTVEIWRS